MCSKSLFDLHADITLEHLTVAPLNLSTVLLEWKVVPSNGHHCITSYNIQVSGPNGSQWRAHIPEETRSFHFTGLQLKPSKEYTYSVNANTLSTQTGPTVKQTSIVEVQGMFQIQHMIVWSLALSPFLRLSSAHRDFKTGLNGLHITAYILI